jgi:hypothetical protein
MNERIEHTFHVAAQEAAMSIQACAQDVAIALVRPHVLMRPSIYPDGNAWCALYGEDLQMGVCGFGDTPAAACADFDKNWCGQRLPSTSSTKAA